MAQKKKPKNPATRTANSLQKVREILFAQDRQETKIRTDHIERRVTREVGALKEDAKKRSAELKALLDDHFAELHDAIQDERDARQKALTALGKRITQLSGTVDKKLADLRHRITKATGDVSRKLDAECDEMRAELDSEIHGMMAAMTDRNDLSKMLGDVAKRLAGKSKK